MQYSEGTFIIVPNKEKIRGLPAHIQTVYLWICSYADEKGECFPSRSRLAQDAGVSTKSIDRAINKLIEINILKKVNRFSAGKREKTSNLYKILGSDPQSLPRDIQSLPRDSQSHRTISSNSNKLKEDPYEEIKRKDRETRMRLKL